MAHVMKIESFLSNGIKLEDYATKDHGWASPDAAINSICSKRDVVRHPNGWEDREHDKFHGVKQRVTFSELAA